MQQHEIKRSQPSWKKCCARVDSRFACCMRFRGNDDRTADANCSLFPLGKKYSSIIISPTLQVYFFYFLVFFQTKENKKKNREKGERDKRSSPMINRDLPCAPQASKDSTDHDRTPGLGHHRRSAADLFTQPTTESPLLLLPPLRRRPAFLKPQFHLFPPFPCLYIRRA